MTKYSLRVLQPDEALAEINKKIQTPGYPNVVKQGLSMVTKALQDAKNCQKYNVHRQIGWAECSCGLQVESETDEKLDTVSERLFRAGGHVDHARAELTSFFVRKWRPVGLNDGFHCWWCTECGYIGEAKVSDKGKPESAPEHECPSVKLKRELLAELKRCLIKPGTKPVVSGAESWNAAINKAIELVGD